MKTLLNKSSVIQKTKDDPGDIWLKWAADAKMTVDRILGRDNAPVSDRSPSNT